MLKSLPAAAFLFAGVVLAQSPATLTFEVASVKPTAPLVMQPGNQVRVAFGRRGGPGTSDPGQINWFGTTLKTLLAAAYDVKAYQISGPSWLDTERYDIVAKVPPGSTKEQVNVMWQSLLAERFGVTLHRTSKTFDVDEMVVAKGGAKLKETTLDPSTPEQDNPFAPPGGAQFADGPVQAKGPMPGPPPLDKNGIPELKAPGLIMMMTMGPNGPNARMVGKAQTLEQLATHLGDQLNRPVVDKTGLTGKYDFVLEFAPDMSRLPLPPGGPKGLGPGPNIALPPGAEPGLPEPSGLPLVGALQQQLGLRLAPKKAPLDVLVIDHAEKVPTEN